MECEELVVCGIIEMEGEWVEDGGVGVGNFLLVVSVKVYWNYLGIQWLG